MEQDSPSKVWVFVPVWYSWLSWGVRWYTPVGGAFRPPMMGDLTQHILRIPAAADRQFGRQDFVVLFEVCPRSSTTNTFEVTPEILRARNP